MTMDKDCLGTCLGVQCLAVRHMVLALSERIEGTHVVYCTCVV